MKNKNFFSDPDVKHPRLFMCGLIGIMIFGSLGVISAFVMIFLGFINMIIPLDMSWFFDPLNEYGIYIFGTSFFGILLLSIVLIGIGENELKGNKT